MACEQWESTKKPEMKKPTSGVKPKKSKKKLRHPTPLPIVLILAMIVCLLTTMVAVIQASAGLGDKLPVTLHSLLFADYSADPHGFRISAVRFSLIEEAIRDAAGDQSLDSANRFATLQAGLRTSVPTVTPAFPQTPTATQQPTSTPDHTEPPPSPSPTSLPPHTATAVPTQLQPSPTIIRWNPTATGRPDKPSKPPEEPDPTDPPPPPPTDPPPPPPTKPPPPPTKPPPPPPDPYPPAYP